MELVVAGSDDLLIVALWRLRSGQKPKLRGAAFLSHMHAKVDVNCHSCTRRCIKHQAISFNRLIALSLRLHFQTPALVPRLIYRGGQVHAQRPAVGVELPSSSQGENRVEQSQLHCYGSCFKSAEGPLPVGVSFLNSCQGRLEAKSWALTEQKHELQNRCIVFTSLQIAYQRCHARVSHRGAAWHGRYLHRRGKFCSSLRLSSGRAAKLLVGRDPAATASCASRHANLGQARSAMLQMAAYESRQ